MSRKNPASISTARRSDEFNYTIIAPFNFRANDDYTFSLTVHDLESKFDEEVIVRASIEDQHTNHLDKVNIHRCITVNPNVTEMISIPVGDLPVGRKYKFVVKGISGTNMEHHAELHFQTQRRMVFIQTDKALYKPNDCVKFRVLVFDLELRAALIENNELKIDIFVSFSLIFVNNRLFK